MSNNQESLEIVRTILGLARSLKMEVIAEGVETLEQAEELRAMNCEYGQGFYFSKALNANNAVRFLSSDPINKLSPPITTGNSIFAPPDSINASRPQTTIVVV
jgi:EAL domain-containing protein (putative c-di-GMP-specific phosphodiesterase class I)